MQEELLRVVDALDLSSASDADLEAKTHSSKDAQSAATVRVGARITEVEVGLLRKAGSCGAGGGVPAVRERPPDRVCRLVGANQC